MYKLFDISFLNGDYHSAIEKLKKGAFMVVPSGPGLATIDKDKRYAEAVQKADFAIPDSGYMVLLLKFFKRINLNKLSGYDFLKHFFKEKISNNDLFLIDPNEKEKKINNLFLNEICIPIEKSYQYVAPMYSDKKIDDKLLLDKLNSISEKPKFIMINLGSGVQEPLGYYLKQNLNYNPGIICTGAAISFFTKSQANISPFIDKLGLGWLWRCISNPIVFIPRYLSAFRLFFLILKTKIKVVK